MAYKPEEYAELMVFLGLALIVFSVIKFSIASGLEADINRWTIERILGVALICSGIYIVSIFGGRERDGFIAIGISLLAPLIIAMVLGRDDFFVRWALMSLLLSPIGIAGVYYIYRARKTGKLEE